MSNARRLFFVCAFSILGQFAIGIYIASMPALGPIFSVPHSAIQNSLTIYLLGFALPQIVYGPCVDAFGRRNTVMASLIIFCIGASISAMSFSIYQLCAGRFIEGLGAAGTVVTSRALLRDLFERHHLTKASAYLAIFWSLFFLGSPLLGGFIQQTLGWQSVFYTLVVIGLILIGITYFGLHETVTRESRLPLSWSRAIANYKIIFSHRVFLGFSCCLFILYGIFMGFNAITPYLIESQMGYTAIAFGAFSMLMSSGYMVGAFITSKIAHRYEMDQMIQTGYLLMIALSLVMALLTYGLGTQIVTIILFTFLYFTALGLVYPNCLAMALSPFTNMAGSGGAAFGFILFLGGMLTTKMVAYLPGTSAMPFALTLFVQAILGSLIYIGFFGLNPVKRRTNTRVA